MSLGLTDVTNQYVVNYISRQQKEAGQKKGNVRFGDALSARRAEQTNRTEVEEHTKSGLVLHITDTETGDTAISAWADAVAGTSVAVYRTQDFDPANPVYKVKIWEKDGTVTEQNVDVSKVNPNNCNTIEMYVYASHLSDSGDYKDALQKFMMAQARNQAEQQNSSYENLFDKKNWVEIIRNIMQSHHDMGNLSGYLDWKKFLDFLEQ